MRFLRIWLILLLALAMPSTATTVVMVRRTCPACGHQFIDHSLGSWFQFDEVERDLSNSLFAAVRELKTCPYCLFTGFVDDFQKLRDKRRREIRAELARGADALRPFPAEARAAVRADPGKAFPAVELRLAQICAPDREDGLAQAMRALASGPQNHDVPGLGEETMGLFLEAGSLALAKDSVARNHLKILYLLGELQRQSGATKDAAATLARVEELVPEDGEKILAKWAGEQGKLALAGNTKPVKNRVSHDQENKEEKVKQLKKSLPGFLAALREGRPRKEWTLPKEKGDLFDEGGLFATFYGARDLAEEGDGTATEFLVAVLAQADAHELDDNMVVSAGTALAKHPALSRAVVAGLKFRTPAIGAAGRYAVLGGPVPDEATTFLAGRKKWSPTVGMVLLAAAVRRDESMKVAVLARIGNLNNSYDFQREASEYLEAVGTTDDLSALEKLATAFRLKEEKVQWTPEWSTREDLESLMLTLRLRSLTMELAGKR